MLLAGKSRLEVAAALGGVSQGTIQKHFPGGIEALKEKRPDVVIPKRPYIHRPHRPGYKPKGKPPLILTTEQETQIRELKEQGKTVREILKVTGLKRGTIYKALNRLGAVKKRS